jgi:hypothetical protein
MNSDLIMRTTKAFTAKMLEETNNDREKAVTLAFDQIYNRQPTEKERQIAQNSMSMEANPQEGLRLFVQAMFGANNFLYSY